MKPASINGISLVRETVRLPNRPRCHLPLACEVPQALPPSVSKTGIPPERTPLEDEVLLSLRYAESNSAAPLLSSVRRRTA